MKTPLRWFAFILMAILASCAAPVIDDERTFSQEEIRKLDDMWLARHYFQYRGPELMAELLNRNLVTQRDRKLIIYGGPVEIGMSEYALIARHGLPKKPDGGIDELILPGNNRRVTYHYQDATFWVENGVVAGINLHH